MAIDPDLLGPRLAKSAEDDTAFERLRSGEPVEMPHAALFARQAEAASKLAAFNAIPPGDMDAKQAALESALGAAGRCMIVQPVFWEYGANIEIGAGTFINRECLFLDDAPIRIGRNVSIGPRVQFLAAGHPVRHADRDLLAEDGRRHGVVNLARPITIGDGCWIGGGAIILGGVTIGPRTTIGAGAVVTRDVPADVMAAGNPARIVRQLD